MKRNIETIATVGMLLLLLVPGRSVFAQWSYQLGVDAFRDSNPLELNGAPPGAAVSATGSAAYYWDFAGAGYAARLTQYDDPDDLSSLAHQGYVTLGRNRTIFSLQAEQRLGTESSLYDYLTVRSNASHRFECLGLGCTVSAGGSIFRFAELIDRNQGSLASSFRIARSFPTRTTVIASSGFGITHYTDLGLTQANLTPDDNVSQWTLNLRLAQSITSSTGLAVFYRRQSVAGMGPVIAVDQETGASYALLDDPSIYNAGLIGFEFTQMLSNYSVAVKVGGSIDAREYPSQGIYDELGTYNSETLRADDLSTMWLRTDWTVSIGSQIVILEVAAQWTDRSSNSFWYDYSSSYLSLGLQFGL